MKPREAVEGAWLGTMNAAAKAQARFTMRAAAAAKVSLQRRATAGMLMIEEEFK